MKLSNALKTAQNTLGENAKWAEFILLEWLKKDKSWLILNEATQINEKAYFRLVKRFSSGEPLEYIFERASFYGLDFSAKKGVLIPRYDSELLLELCLNELKNKNYENVLEIGFGSGILSIVLAKILGIKITACDISKKAFLLAKQNAKAHGVEHLIDFRLCDFKTLNSEFDFIFSNPPYIRKSHVLDAWVKMEPKRALFGGKFGHEKLESIVKFAKKGGTKTLICEFGFNQKGILHKILHKNGFNADFFKDTGGFDRVFVAKNIIH